ncbi:MAG: glycogen debranching enzyme GlgX, partial [Gammaproteobacteria bacterium]|nr:glycogen debranching enzyme GlgX [Gammaproteobacteria bacterium]
LVSYRDKHNLANGEDNRDGHHTNFSENYGVEGETNDPGITSLRWRQMRNFVATLMLSQGTPMLLAGDEIGHTKDGNNNAYCQDNELNWLDWKKIPKEGLALSRFVARLTALRRRYPVLHRSDFVHGSKIGEDSELLDICWISPHGQIMLEAQWKDPSEKCLGVLLSDRIHSETANATDATQTLLLIFHSGEPDLHFKLPEIAGHSKWRFLISTSRPEEGEGAHLKNSGETIPIAGRSVEVWGLGKL